MKSSSVVALLSIAITTSAVVRAEPCDRVLDLAGQDMIQANSTQSFSVAAKRLLCARDERGRTSDTSFKLNLPFPELNGVFGAENNDRSRSTRRTSVCDDMSYQLDRSSAEQVFKLSGNAEALKQWGECMKGNRQGLTCEVTREGAPREFRVTIVLRAPPTVATVATVIGTPVDLGVRCEGVPSKLEDKVSAAFKCTKAVQGRASTTLNTDHGSLACLFPGDPPEVKPGDEGRDCSRGVEAACQALEQRAYVRQQACIAKLHASATTTIAEEIANASAARACGNEAFVALREVDLIRNLGSHCSAQRSSPAECELAKKALAASVR